MTPTETFAEKMSAMMSTAHTPEDEKLIYQTTINELVLLVHTSMVEQDDFDELHVTLMTLKEITEIVANIFQYPLAKIEEDMLYAMDTLPLEDMAQAAEIRQAGMLN